MEHHGLQNDQLSRIEKLLSGWPARSAETASWAIVSRCSHRAGPEREYSSPTAP